MSMKKLSMLFAALLLAGGGVMFTGCSDDDDNKEQTGEITILKARLRWMQAKTNFKST